MPWPQIVAEALRRVDGRVDLAGRPATPATPAAVLDAIAAAQVPSRSNLPPPAFLHTQQHDSWRRVMAALDIWKGALLLEPPGSGKTWIALGVAALERGPVVAVVPAILQGQWHDAAARARVALHVWTHERASRGALPDVHPSLVIIDEAHRFREPSTRRLRTIAPWLVNRRTLLLTATPIVNRLADLITLLHVALPDDALSLDGIARLSELDSWAQPPTALRRVSVRGQAAATAMLDRRVTLLRPTEPECQRAASDVAAIDRLELSRIAGTRRLLASVLLDAAGSSDAAFFQALRRYRALLLQSRDAGGASRAMLRKFAGDALEQLVFWPLLTTDAPAAELSPSDIEQVERTLARAPDDQAWITELTLACNDDRPTVWFTRHRATARALRGVLGDGAAWVTGAEAGIGPHRMPRAAVLAAFGNERDAWRLRRHRPRILIATDVAAEGLDLQSAGRIMHIDLPWTATRIEQREGRLLRIGQRHPQVDIVIRVPGPAIELALARHARVRRKRRLADEWLHALERVDGPARSTAPGALLACAADDGDEIDLVAVRMEQDRKLGVLLVTRTGGGPWSAVDAVPPGWIDRLHDAVPCEYHPIDARRAQTGAIHAAITSCRGAEAAPARVVSRIHRLARLAASRRDARALLHLDRLLRFASASTTLGGRALLAELLDANDDEFLGRQIPDLPAGGSAHATVIAVLLLRNHAGPVGAA